MKSGARALGVADSYVDEHSVVAGCVVRADRVVDDLVFDRWSVGGTDATATIIRIFERLGREDVQYLLVSGIAPAWFNILDCRTIAAETGLPTISVSFEESEGLEGAIWDAFDDDDAVQKRLEIYRKQPDRRELTVNDDTIFVRSAGIEDGAADEAVRRFTPEGGRPEPLRIARLAARAGDDFFGNR